MDYRLCLRAKFSVRMQMSHNIVAKFLFVYGFKFIVDIVRMRLHFSDLLVRYRKSEFLFAFGKSAPEFSPC